MNIIRRRIHLVLFPINQHHFDIDLNSTNYILAVDAYCCPVHKFLYENYHNIDYYPVSFVGIEKDIFIF